VCGKEERVWFPTDDQRYSSLEKHPWCKHCGLVENISDDRPKKIGYWMNLFSYICSLMPVTQVQKRLIAKEIESSEVFQDMFGTFGSDQKIRFIQILSKYIPVHSLNLDLIISI
jgi:hypothetical protein